MKNILYQGQHINLVQQGGWEFAERPHVYGIVAVIGVTSENKIILVEQFRPPVNRRVIELPAGLAGDEEDNRNEALWLAAKREFLEETGYAAEAMKTLIEGPPSAGITSEIITFFRADKLKKISSGGGVGNEELVVHEVALDTIDTWLQEMVGRGLLIDPKVYLGLYFANHESNFK